MQSSSALRSEKGVAGRDRLPERKQEKQASLTHRSRDLLGAINHVYVYSSVRTVSFMGVYGYTNVQFSPAVTHNLTAAVTQKCGYFQRTLP